MKTTIYGILLGVLLVSCGNNNEASSDKESGEKKRPFGWVRSIIGNFSNQDTVFIDSSYAKQFLASYADFKAYEEDILKFYEERNNAYAWYEGNRIIEHAGNLFHRVRDLTNDGLGDSIAYFQRFEELMDRPNRKANRQELELMLTAQYFGLAHQAWKGLDGNVGKRNEWYIPRKRISFSNYLDSMLNRSDNEFLENEPVNPQYLALRKALSEFRELRKNNPQWPTLVADKKKYEMGSQSAFIAQVKSRLHVLGYLKNGDSSQIFDQGLKSAVEEFQRRHGLEPDGIIGKSLIDELNISPSKRIEKILVNMERVRWLPVDMSKNDNYILVNIPEYKLHVYEKNELQWQSNVVVGETVNQTVIFSGMMDHIVFSPHWNIPESIVKDEIMPMMERDPGYLSKQNLEIVSEKDGIPTIRQKPGKENSLGLVKFMFPNTYNIYLHDSPAKHLYYQNERAFSHGCIRVAEVEKLARYVLRDMPEWNDSKITEAMNSGDEKYVNLKTPVPVYLVYLTSWVDDEGKLQFRKDIYQNDARLARMIFDEGNSDISLLR